MSTKRTPAGRIRTRRVVVEISESQEKEIDHLISDLDSNFRRDWFLTERGEKVEGVLLDADECQLLMDFWRDIKHRRKGRPIKQPSLSLFGDTYREEFEREKAKILATGEQRGSVQRAIAVLAQRYRIEPDAMRKRIYGQKTKQLKFRKK
jgi:hypothetical protein